MRDKKQQHKMGGKDESQEQEQVMRDDSKRGQQEAITRDKRQ